MKCTSLVGLFIAVVALSFTARDAVDENPAPALEIFRGTNGVHIALHGEPYGFYRLQESATSTGGFINSTTNLRSADSPIGVRGFTNPAPIEPDYYYRAEYAP